MVSFAYYKNMIVSVDLIVVLVNEYFTPEWQINVCDITCKMVASHAWSQLRQAFALLGKPHLLFQYISFPRVETNYR